MSLETNISQAQLKPSAPSVSVIMPAFNAEQFIVESMHSVLKSEWVSELIVVNDRSTDRTPDHVKSVSNARVRLVEGPGRGISAAFNAGLEAAVGDYICRCDADDLYPHDRIETQIKLLHSKVGYVAVSSGFEMITDKGQHVTSLEAVGTGRDVTDELLSGQTITHLCTWLIKREAVVEIGGARTWFESAEDIDLQFRIAATGKVWHEPGVAYRYRLHDSSITHSKSTERVLFYEHCARAFAKQRLATKQDDLDLNRAPEAPAPSANASSARKHILGQMIGRAWAQQQAGQPIDAIRCAAKTVRFDPLQLDSWRCLLLITLKSLSRNAK